MRGRAVLVAVLALAVRAAGSQQISTTTARFTDLGLLTNGVSTAKLLAPANVRGTVTCTAVLRSNDVRWDSVTHASGYRVERAVGTGSFSTLTTSLLGAITDVVTTSGTYHYRVVATREGWTSPVSATVSLVQPSICL